MVHTRVSGRWVPIVRLQLLPLFCLAIAGCTPRLGPRCGGDLGPECYLLDEETCVNPTLSESYQDVRTSPEGAEAGIQRYPPCALLAYLTCEDDRFYIRAYVTDPELAILGDGSLRAYSTVDNTLVTTNHGGDHGTEGRCSLRVSGEPAAVPCMRAAFDRLGPLVEDYTCGGEECDSCDCHINEVWPGLVDDDCDVVFQGDE